MIASELKRVYPRQRRDGTWYLGVVECGANLADHCIAEFGQGDDARANAEYFATIFNDQ